MNKNNQFGEKLKKLRKEAKYTQDHLAGIASISGAYISQLETGKKKPTDRVIAKLSGALDIPENRLFITIGKFKMDFAKTLAIGRNEAPKLIAALPDEQWEELVKYLAYIKVKSTLF